MFIFLIGTLIYITSIYNIVSLFLNYSPEIKHNKVFNPNVIYSPTQGTVQNITYNEEQNELTIRVFLGPLDNHTQYYPVDGKVTDQVYKKGEFNPAFLFKKSKYNESFTTILEFETNPLELPNGYNSKKTKIVITQIAGVLARRIRTEDKIGQTIEFGEKLGKILLGSAVDITLDSRIFKPVVQVSDKVFPLETIISSTFNVPGV